MRAVVDALPGFIPGSPAASASIKTRELQDSAFKLRDRRGVISPPRIHPPIFWNENSYHNAPNLHPDAVRKPKPSDALGSREPHNSGGKEIWNETGETQDAEGLSQLTRKLCFEDETERRASFGEKNNLPVLETRRRRDILR